MFSRCWAEPEKPPPERQRPAPVAKNQPPQSFPKTDSAKKSRSAAVPPRRKRRQAPSFKLIRIFRRFLDPRPRP